MKTRVAVLGGGVSAERDISLASARAVCENLPGDEFAVRPVEILADGRWQAGGSRPVPAEKAVARLKAAGVSVVFIGLHGPPGEDGTIQGFLETSGLPYVGSGVAASAIAMDKARAREVLAAQGLRVVPGVELSGLGAAEAARFVEERIGLPAVVKEPRSGSSIGVQIAKNGAALRRALGALLGRAGGRALVERYVAGRELSVPVIGNASRGGPIEALPPLLIRPRGRPFFDYRSKYDPRLADEICPAPVSPAVLRRVTEAAIRAHQGLGCDGLSRTDFIAPPRGAPWVLEINTLPGLTAASLCPKSAAAAGIPFPELLRRLVRLALDRSDRGGS